MRKWRNISGGGDKWVILNLLIMTNDDFVRSAVEFMAVI